VRTAVCNENALNPGLLLAQVGAGEVGRVFKRSRKPVIDYSSDRQFQLIAPHQTTAVPGSAGAFLREVQLTIFGSRHGGGNVGGPPHVAGESGGIPATVD
jgi:hypothetical protein